MKETRQAILNWAAGLLTVEDMQKTARGNGYKITREGDVIHASGKQAFSLNIKREA